MAYITHLYIDLDFIHKFYDIIGLHQQILEQNLIKRTFYLDEDSNYFWRILDPSKPHMTSHSLITTQGFINVSFCLLENLSIDKTSMPTVIFYKDNYYEINKDNYQKTLKIPIYNTLVVALYWDN